MRRTHFSLTGKHPLLYVVRDHLIQSGYALVGHPDEAAGASVFMLAGCYGDPEVHPGIPTLLLSSSRVYGDRDHSLNLREPAPMDEADGHVITSSLDPSVRAVLEALISEWRFLNRTEGRTIVVRPFNVFGPGVESGVIHAFIQAVRDDRPLEVHTPGRQTRTFLYVDDFLEATALLVGRLLHGSRGIYNIGSSESVEVLSLAKSVCHAWNVDPEIRIVESTERHQWWKVPALDRIHATKWKARTSLRSALFRMAGK